MVCIFSSVIANQTIRITHRYQAYLKKEGAQVAQRRVFLHIYANLGDFLKIRACIPICFVVYILSSVFICYVLQLYHRWSS